MEVGNFTFTLNGQKVRIDGLPPQVTLLEYIRKIGLTGAKEGCGEGGCGACAVLFVESGPGGTCYRSVNSCLVPLPMAVGGEILTIEGLASSDRLLDVQRALVEQGGSQCGYCTPGVVISMFAEQYRRTASSLELAVGNLCRCTGYRPIVKALQSLNGPEPGSHLDRLGHSAPVTEYIRYAGPGGAFFRPKTLSECLEILEDHPEARPVAGNTDLGVVSSRQGIRYGHLVAVGSVFELRAFSDGPDFVEIGAALTLSEIAELWPGRPAAVDAWLEKFGSSLVRNRATIGGGLVTASPFGDTATLLLALDATATVASRVGTREIPLSAFFAPGGGTVLQRGEIVVSVRIAKPFPDCARFYKVTKRRCVDIGVVAAGISLWQGGDGAIARARIALSGFGPTPTRAYLLERALVGTRGGQDEFARAGELLSAMDPIDDFAASQRYRRAVAGGLLMKFQVELSGRQAGL